MNENIQIKTKQKKSLRREILEWLGILTVGAIFLFFFAPESWWQFGVFPENERKTSSAFVLRGFKDGADWNFSQKRGQILVVNYWATWCSPCSAEMPGLVNAANEYKSRNVEFVGVTMDEDMEVIAPFVEKYQIPYQILLPGNDPNIGTKVLTLPTTFLYDKNGKLAKKYTGIVLESTLKSDIEELLKEK